MYKRKGECFFKWLNKVEYALQEILICFEPVYNEKVVFFHFSEIYRKLKKKFKKDTEITKYHTIHIYIF